MEGETEVELRVAMATAVGVWEGVVADILAVDCTQAQVWRHGVCDGLSKLKIEIDYAHPSDCLMANKWGEKMWYVSFSRRTKVTMHACTSVSGKQVNMHACMHAKRT